VLAKALQIIAAKFILWICFSAACAADRIDGYEIKKQARNVVSLDGIPLELVVSDKRTFFPCSDPLMYSPRLNNDWSAIEVKCPSEKWSTVLRNKQTATVEIYDNEVEGAKNTKIIVMKKNISKGVVLTAEHIEYSSNFVDGIAGSFSDFEDVIGRKAKFSLARGAILKARQLAISYPIEKGKAVLLVADSKQVSISVNAIALEDGQIGDIIKVRNIVSGRTLHAIIKDEKKVSPLTNM
jgi:flagella basal body P-ring formation protein FlgA